MDHPKVRIGDDGSLLLNFGTYGDDVDVAAISGDGTRLLTVRDVGRAEIWSVSSGEKLGEIRPTSPLEGREDVGPGNKFVLFIESAALNENGTQALLGLNDGTAGLFDVASGSRTALLCSPDEPAASRWGVIRAVAFSPDETLALVGFPGRAVGVWEVSSSRGHAAPRSFLRASAGTRLFRTPFVRDTLVSSVAASRSNQVVFAGCADFSAVIWKLETGAVVLEATEHTAECLALFDAADGAGWVTTAGTVWRLNRRGALERIAATGASWAEAVFSSEGVLARRLDGGVDSVSWKGEVEHLYQPPEPVVGHWSSRAETLIRRRDRVVFPMTGKKVVVQVGTRHVQVERSAQLVRAKLHPDGGRLALQGWTEEIELWFLHDRGAAHLRAFPCPGGVGDFDFSEDGTRLATGTIGNGGGHYDRDVLVYDVESGQLLRRLRHHQWQLKRVRFAPDGRSLATLADEVCLWQLNRDAPPVCIGVEGGRTEADLEFLSDGRLLIVDRQRIRVFREASLIASFPAPIAFRTKWCVSPDARSVLVAIEGGFVRFELESGRELESIRVDCPRPDALPPPDLARDLKARGGVGLWRTAFGQFLHQSDGPRGWVQPVRLFPSGDVAIPTQAGVAVLHVGDVVSPRGVVPFSGKLRASWIRDGRVVLVNHEGRIFASSLGATG